MRNYLNGQPPALPESLSNPPVLYAGLKNLEATAIDFMYKKVRYHLSCKKHQTRATEMDVEELASDAVVLMLRKIGDGSYAFQGFSPVGFGVVIADNLLRNFCRKMRLDCQSLEEADIPSIQPEVEAYLSQKELKMQVRQALRKLSGPCQQVIRLKYFDNLKDEEVVAQGLSPHRNTDSLKSSRCRCLKRLGGLLKNP